MPGKSNESESANAFGKKVRSLRLAAGLTLQQVSERTGFGVGLLSRLETSASYNPKLDTIQKLAAALGCRACDLIGE